MLLKHGIIKNTGRGYIDPNAKGDDGLDLRIGYYRTVTGHHRYIQDEYAIKAERLMNQRGIKNEGK